MALGLRLALWYGALTVAVVMLIGLSTYAIHSRAHYEDLDQMLVGAAQHANSETMGSLPASQLDQVLAVPASPEVSTLVYGPDGILARSPNGSGVPHLNPATVMRQPSGPAFGPLVGLAPAFISIQASPGAFGIALDANGGRWRIYVLPVSSSGRYLEVAAPLGRIDASVDRLAWLLIVLGTLGSAAAFMAAWLVAGHALHPIRSMTTTAAVIARSRSFSERVPLTPHDDELRRLALTFNEMLQSLEVAYEGQQRFVADASHELRAPLTAIQANLELLERHRDMPETDRREAVSEASREAARLGRLVAELLALARADAGVTIRSQHVELDRVALEAVREARHLAGGRKVEIEALDPVSLSGDPDRLKELLLILLDNAVKYTPEQGVISLRLRRNGTHAEVAVSDNGLGIPPGDLPHIFDRFYRADPARSNDPGGSGLGLAIALWIAERHGGSIRIQSEPGSGTRATVSLPLAA